MNAIAQLRTTSETVAWRDPIIDRESGVDHLSALALSLSPDDLWDEMLNFCRRLSCPEICFLDMIGDGRGANVVRATFDPAFDPDGVREALSRAGCPTMMDARTLALPGFGPQGLEAALVVSLDMRSETPAEWTLSLGIAFQLAYSRYRQMSPLARGDVALSEREREIMCWVTRGKSNGVIAAILGISASTVDTYMRRIFRKLDVADRTSAAIRARSIGAIT